MRNKLRAMVLGGLFSRQTKEVFAPLVEYCFSSMLARGKLGLMPGSREHLDQLLFGGDEMVIPDDIAKAMINGDEVYEIEFLTPAARMLNSELAEGIINTWKFCNDVAQTQPEVYDNVDEDLSVQLVAKFMGAPREILRDARTMGTIRNTRAQQQQADKKFQQGIETAKAMGHLKGLAPQQPAPGVVNEQLAQPINA
jgi:hypothetical protein